MSGGLCDTYTCIFVCVCVCVCVCDLIPLFVYIFICNLQFVELNRPLIFRRQQVQPTSRPRSPVDQARNENVARRAPPEQGKLNERPRNVHFAVGEESMGAPMASGASGGGPSSAATVSTPASTSAAMTTVVSEMDRMQISGTGMAHQVRGCFL